MDALACAYILPPAPRAGCQAAPNPPRDWFWVEKVQARFSAGPATQPRQGKPILDNNPLIAERIETRLDRVGLEATEVDRLVGLPAGTAQALAAGKGRLPRGQALLRLVAVLETDLEFLLGLEPGDLVPPDMLEDPQGELGLLAPDEEALLRHYRRLDVPARAAFVLIIARAAGPEPLPQAKAKPEPRRQKRS